MNAADQPKFEVRNAVNMGEMLVAKLQPAVRRLHRVPSLNRHSQINKEFQLHISQIGTGCKQNQYSTINAAVI